ncbi:hypothetical protein ACMA5I_00375 [Paracoccaceae bacterium GXU_MW_L88]
MQLGKPMRRARSGLAAYGSLSLHSGFAGAQARAAKVPSAA